MMFKTLLFVAALVVCVVGVDRVAMKSRVCGNEQVDRGSVAFAKCLSRVRKFGKDGKWCLMVILKMIFARHIILFLETS